MTAVTAPPVQADSQELQYVLAVWKGHPDTYISDIRLQHGAINGAFPCPKCVKNFFRALAEDTIRGLPREFLADSLKLVSKKSYSSVTRHLKNPNVEHPEGSRSGSHCDQI
jgi:hypothetical protein